MFVFLDNIPMLHCIQKMYKKYMNKNENTYLTLTIKVKANQSPITNCHSADLELISTTQ